MFRIHALEADLFAALHCMDDAELKARHARRVVADKSPGFPCRVSLEDAASGETLVLLNFMHHDVDSPYRANGPIYVREAATTAQPDAGEVPFQLSRRQLAVRAFDAHGEQMLAYAVIDGKALAETLVSMFENAAVDYALIYNSGAGCYAARATRA